MAPSDSSVIAATRAHRHAATAPMKCRAKQPQLSASSVHAAHLLAVHHSSLAKAVPHCDGTLRRPAHSPDTVFIATACGRYSEHAQSSVKAAHLTAGPAPPWSAAPAPPALSRSESESDSKHFVRCSARLAGQDGPTWEMPGTAGTPRRPSQRLEKPWAREQALWSDGHCCAWARVAARN